MTDLRNGQMTDLLQNDLKHNPDVLAISFAVQREKQRILALEAKTRTLSMIDELDGPILDVLSVELRIPYYSQSDTLEQKRAIIKSAMPCHNKAGTMSGMLSALQAIHNHCSVDEWFNYGAQPGYFRIGIDVTSSGISAAQFESILGSIQLTKNARSWLDSIRCLCDCTPARLHVATWAGCAQKLHVWPAPGGIEAGATEHTGGPGAVSRQRIEIY